jgi:acetyl esterase/lipase
MGTAISAEKRLKEDSEPMPLLHKRPSWNTSFASIVAVLRTTANRIPLNVSLIRMFTDHSIPTWLPTLPDGVLSTISTIPPGEWFYPQESGLHLRINGSPTPMSEGQYILYFHGGAFCCCSSGTHRGLLYRLVQMTGASILAVDYRRPPEYPYPTPVDDCLSAYLYILEKVGDSSRIILAGDSAGGNLVLATLDRIINADLPIPRGGLLLSPWVDLTDCGRTPSWQSNVEYDYITSELAQFFADCYVGAPPGAAAADARATTAAHQPASVHPPATDPDDQEVSIPLPTDDKPHPMTYLSPLYFNSLHLFPPLHVEFGDCEVLHDQILSFCHKVQDLGVDITYHAREDMIHVFPIYSITGMKQCDDSLMAMTHFVDKQFFGERGVAV